MRKLIGWIFSFILILGCLSGCDTFDYAPVMFKVVEPTEIEKFPAKITVKYYFKNNVQNMYGRDYCYTFGRYRNSVGHEKTKIYLVEPKDNGYIVNQPHSKIKNYTIPEDELSDFGFSEIVNFDKQNGQFEITVQNKNEYIDFKNNNIFGFNDICHQIDCYKEDG